MTAPGSDAHRQAILDAAESHFGAPVDRFETPGGSTRSSVRLHIGERTVIATLRKNRRRTHLEAVVLARLGAVCDVVPKMLGLVGDVMFQQDIGDDRLNRAILHAKGEDRVTLAAAGIDSIFRYQSAARQTDLAGILPPLGQGRDWSLGLIRGADFIEGVEKPVALDRDAIADVLTRPPETFVKWDCRAGNAGVSPDGALRWFDFEFCGIRHGVEDLAWLIGDETWPVRAEVMLDLVRTLLPAPWNSDPDAYIGHLSMHCAFHASQRLALIHDRHAESGWKKRARIARYDLIGAHPKYGAALCAAGIVFADRSPLTRPMVPAFERARARFAEAARALPKGF